jgi:hypothetical protein
MHNRIQNMRMKIVGTCSMREKEKICTEVFGRKPEGIRR